METTSHSAEARSGRRHELVLDDRQIQAGGQDGDQDQQHDRRDLCVDHRVGGAVRRCHGCCWSVHNDRASNRQPSARPGWQEVPAMCAFVALRITGVGETNTTPPLRMWAAAVKSRTRMTATNIQSSKNVKTAAGRRKNQRRPRTAGLAYQTTGNCGTAARAATAPTAGNAIKTARTMAAT